MRHTALVVLVALLAACGGSSGERQAAMEGLQLEVAVTPEPLVSGQPAAFELHVTNVSDRRVAMTFDTTQRGDVRLSTVDSVEVYHWANRRAFAREEEDVTLVPGQRQTFELEETVLPVAPGEYLMFATVVGQPNLQVARRTISVKGPSVASESSSAPVTETSSPAPVTESPPPQTAAARLASAADKTVTARRGRRRW